MFINIVSLICQCHVYNFYSCKILLLNIVFFICHGNNLWWREKETEKKNTAEVSFVKSSKKATVCTINVEPMPLQQEEC